MFRDAADRIKKMYKNVRGVIMDGTKQKLQGIQTEFQNFVQKAPEKIMENANLQYIVLHV